MKCAMCGYPRIEEHGTEPGDYNWFLSGVRQKLAYGEAGTERRGEV